MANWKVTDYKYNQGLHCHLKLFSFFHNQNETGPLIVFSNSERMQKNCKSWSTHEGRHHTGTRCHLKLGKTNTITTSRGKNRCKPARRKSELQQMQMQKKKKKSRCIYTRNGANFKSTSFCCPLKSFRIQMT